ncbi:MAG TPA: ATP-binding protein [Vicinamibacterales bacterium]|jgi:signal transduction histidine kinase/ActR/RegA family two-component response regulator|nr:ATP-binding protein [Vicinamibacterales bacterium]
MPEPGPFEALDVLGVGELRQRLQSLQAVIARAPVPIAIAHDPDCRFISGNRALAALLGLPADANFSLTPGPVERPLYRIQRYGRDLQPDELPMQYAIAHRCSFSNEIEIVRADGSILHVQNDVEPLYDTRGRIYGCVSVCVDLTDRKRAEHALREADRRKDEFLATLSHELRNPLAPIRTALEVMRLAQGNAAVVEKARATIERQLLQLVRLTDDLLDVARITQDKVHLRRERIDLRSVVQQAVEAIRSLADAQRHALSIDLPPTPIWVDADPVRLAQAFSNLLNNATKFTEPGGKIDVRADVDGHAVAVSISDSGVGIPAAMLPRVFEMFTQLQGYRDRALGGLGIGLTLAKRLVELHGGTIDAHSEGLGRGSTFTARLPIAPAIERSAEGGGADRIATSAACRVLIAEDNADAADMMRVMLELKGHDVRVAADGLEAVAIANEFMPMIAFLDIGMPNLDGFEAARQIRARLGQHVMLVALTGWGQDEDKRRSREAGFDHHLTKPPEPDLLARLIDGCGDRRRL